MASTINNLITVDQLDAFPDDGNRYELVEGELFVSRAPGIPHQRVLLNLELLLAEYLKLKPIGIIVPGAGAVFSVYDAVIPDLVFVPTERWEKVVANDRFVGAPDLIIEIVSPGKENRRRDLSVKRQLYAKYQVKEYWIVDPENRSVSTFCLEDNSLKESGVATGDHVISSSLFPGLELSVPTIFNL